MTGKHLKSKRVLIKISGEALMGSQSFGLEEDSVSYICNQIKNVYDIGHKICIVVGGGNIFRGVTSSLVNIDRVNADHMGMLGTCMNAIALQGSLEKIGVSTRIQSAIPMSTISEPYIKRRAARHLDKGRVVIFSAGTGNPFFTTDTASVLRAIEMGCDFIIKGTQVDGVYCSDPKKNKDATRFGKISYDDVIKKNLRVMDQTAIALAKDNKLPLIVYSLKGVSSLADIINFNGKFTLINDE